MHPVTASWGETNLGNVDWSPVSVAKRQRLWQMRGVPLISRHTGFSPFQNCLAWRLTIHYRVFLYHPGALAMNAPNSSSRLQMEQFQHSMNTVLTGSQAEELSGLFQVPLDQIQFARHPLNGDRNVLKITFLYGVNVAAALASFFNNEFYRIPRHERTRDLTFKQSAYAFVDTEQPGEVLCLTVAEPIASFLRRLKQHENDIRYVMQNPQILFMIRADVDYRTARTNLQRSSQPII
jgi:hypothetical protein